MLAVGKNAVGGRASFHEDGIQRDAPFKSASGHLCKRKGDADAFQLFAAAERLCTDLFNRIGKFDIAKSRASEKGAVFDLADAVFQLRAKKIFALKKGVSADLIHRACDIDLGKALASGKSIGRDDLHAVEDMDLLQKRASVKGAGVDLHDGLAVKHGGDFHFGQQTVFIPRDDDLAVLFLIKKGYVAIAEKL